MFSSMLQEHLGVVGRGKCDIGKIEHLTLAKDVRARVESRIRRIHYFSSPFTVSFVDSRRILDVIAHIGSSQKQPKRATPASPFQRCSMATLQCRFERYYEPRDNT
jgi:hypothetical protein